MTEPKDYKLLRIVFMGTPAFAVPSLQKLVDAGCNIVGVITAPDKPGGRGLELQQSAVKQYAVSKGLNVLQPEKLKAPDFVEALRSLNADVQVVVAFRMLPEIVWKMPPLGTINLHGSLLPQYRGAAPINWAIINGEKETGVTTFRLQHAIDTGNILLHERIPIHDQDTAGTLHDTMMETGAALLLETIRQLAAGNLQEQPQSNIPAETLRHAPKIFTEDCRLDFTKTVDEVNNLVRGLSPYPAAFTYLEDKKLKVFAAEKILLEHAFQPGEMISDKANFISFACNNGFINVTSIQLEGKKRMDVKDFLRGYRFL